MPTRRSSTSLLLSIVCTAVLAPSAHADASPENVTYVATRTGCSDSGPGTDPTAPFCTLQAAVDAAAPGTTVELAWNTVENQIATVTASGTAEDPITIRPAPGDTPVIGQILGNPGTIPALTFSGANYVDVTGVTLGGVTTQFAQIEGSAHIDFDEIGFDWESYEPNEDSGPFLEVAGTSSDVVLTRSTITMPYQGSGTVVQLDSGTTGDVIAGNAIRQGSLEGSGTQAAIVATGATDTEITSNTIDQYGPFCGSTIVLAEGSVGTTIENNVLEGNEASCDGGAAQAVLEVDPTSESGSVADYNLLYAPPQSLVSTFPAYEWGGVTYSTVSSFTAATGQGSHDLVSNPDPSLGASPTINSANSAAPGMPATDLDGNGCSYDPYVPITGAGSPAYCTRGAVQYQSAPLTVTVDTSPLSALEAQAYDAAQAPADPQGFSIDWGDGQTTDSASSATHYYARPGLYTVTETVTDQLGEKISGSTSFSTRGTDFTPYGPTRILDTRSGTGASKGLVASGSVIKLRVAGTGSIPAGIGAVVMNLTAVDGTGNGFISAYPDGSAVPRVSNLNYGKAAPVANEAFVPVGADGYVDLLNSGAGPSVSVDLIADVTGYFSAAQSSSFYSLDPTRILDTRNGTGAAKAKVAPHGSIQLAITIPASSAAPKTGITAVSLHVTAVDATANGFVTAYPDGQTRPTASNLNDTTGAAVSNTVVVPVGADGKVDLYNGSPTGSVDLIADITGYYSTTTVTGLATVFVPVTPSRVADTRTSKAMTPGSTVTFRPVGGHNTMPAPDTTYVVNLTVTAATGNGLITAWPHGEPTPNTSNLNYLRGQTVANLAQIRSGSIDASGNDVIASNTESGGTVEFIADVFGYYTLE
ncbi:hypothetical protein KDL01_03015 [Actinospica durhamensis]|uniref:PKD domain-containing protein n=1 Tax=Actinospica durhamensis TaxID=1508375 RepID=A0A941INN0_9ACTN|nr:PKD domain-containing protein [Actinospica durhamensis]MBR7832212.1 hypothetical protein [Actinospica durhamensis]